MLDCDEESGLNESCNLPDHSPSLSCEKLRKDTISRVEILNSEVEDSDESGKVEHEHAE